MRSTTRRAAVLAAAAVLLVPGAPAQGAERQTLAEVKAASEAVTAGRADCNPRTFTPRVRSQKVYDGVRITHGAAVELEPGQTASDVAWEFVEEFTAFATIDGTSRPRLGDRLIARASRQTGRRLKKVGATTDKGTIDPTAQIVNDTGQTDTFVAYRGTVAMYSYVVRSSCVRVPGRPAHRGKVLWKRVGRWGSYLKVVQGVGSCAQESDGRVERAAVTNYCR